MPTACVLCSARTQARHVLGHANTIRCARRLVVASRTEHPEGSRPQIPPGTAEAMWETAVSSRAARRSRLALD